MLILTRTGLVTKIVYKCMKFRLIVDQNKSQRDSVHDEVGRLVVRVEASQEEQHDGHYGQKFASWCVLQPVVQLLPVSQVPHGTYKKYVQIV